MDTTESKFSSNYEKPPWLFKGSSLYQLHLVKADLVRSIIPKELKLVEAFGYTLGGFFLANYDESPAAAFDELVVIAGIVWNPPTSCAWAANVLVSSNEACVHGRKAVGLPSQVAKFSKKISANRQSNTLLSTLGFGDSLSYMDVEVSETTGRSYAHLCNISIPTSFSEDKSKWMAPEIKMNLPSFSGRTLYNENLLKYSCEVRCRLSIVKPAVVSRISSSTETKNGTSTEGGAKDAPNLSVSLMLSKPILALKFDSLKMLVDAPVIVSSKEDSCR